ncbi:hypothetical protein LVJ82_14360 [Vitreoscilla massiliensis]|uniref:Uncharacterized protein n=1 Tax=Vitreoscilla massiliensis TaxID=1689272 RepID=A0ABY4DYP7_9NEIS|nr:hypothetical protein [Vitreoscilla massiliensis]UOO88636.1 hypothetical protein LVJ82_14360 [Vitreoscilla massiliensis]
MSKPKYKWVYQTVPKTRPKPKQQALKPVTPAKKSKLLNFLVGLAMVLLAFTALTSWLDIKSRSKETLSTIMLSTQQPQFVGTYAYGGGGKSSSTIGMRVVDEQGRQYHVMRGDIPMHWPAQQLKHYDAVLLKTLPTNFQTADHAHIKVVAMRSLVWGKFQHKDDLTQLTMRLQRQGFNYFNPQSGPVYVLPIEMDYWQEGKLFHYQRPASEYQDKINAQCPSCLRGNHDASAKRP